MPKIDDFFDNHDINLGVFAVGLVVIMSLIIGGGVVGVLIVESFQQVFGGLSIDIFLALVGALELAMCIAVIIPNIMIVRGKPNAAKANRVHAYVQVTCYLLALLALINDRKMGLVFASIFPLFTIYLMSTNRYQIFIGFYEAIHKDPEGYRRRVLGE